MKQKIITSEVTSDMVFQLDTALSYGWLVHQIAVSSYGNWIAVLYRNDDETSLA